MAKHVYDKNGKYKGKILSDKEMGKKEDGENIGKKLAKNLLSSGGNDILNF